MTELHNRTHCAECTFRSLLFDHVSAPDLDKLNRSKIEYLFESGEIIIHEGQPIREFVYLQKGLVKLSRRTQDGKDHIISISMPKSFIGFLSVFSEEHYKYTITAIQDSILCFIDIETIREIIHKNGAFAMNVLKKISKVSDEIIFSRVNICSRQMRGRIAYLLILFAKDVFINSRFELPITRREIGELVDLSTANVIRVLSEFRKDGILQVDGHHFKIMNFQVLERFANFGWTMRVMNDLLTLAVSP